MARETDSKASESLTLASIGAVYDALGERQKALDSYNQALDLARAIGDRANQAVILNNLAVVYYWLGEKQQSLDLLEQVLALRQKLGDKAGEATTLNNLGRAYSDFKEPQKALEFYDRALRLFQETGNKTGSAIALNNIGRIYASLSDFPKALAYYNQALPLSQDSEDQNGIAIALDNIASAYLDLGNPQTALEYYNRALPLRTRIGDRSGEARSRYGIAQAQRARGDLNAARENIESALQIIEDLRAKIGSQQLRTSYFATVQNYYQFYIDLLMQLHQNYPNRGYDAQALHANERAKARSLLEILTEANADIRQGIDPQLLERERNLQQQLNATEQSRLKLLEGQYQQRQLNELTQKIDALATELQRIEAQIRSTNPRYANLKYPQPLTVPQIQQQILEADTLLLAYHLGEERSYLWAVSKTGITSHLLPKRSEIEALAKDFYAQLLGGAEISNEVGGELSQILLSPVTEQLKNQRLLIVSEGALQYIPFAALPLPLDSTQPLLVQNEILSLPSASTLGLLRQELKDRPLAPKRLAIIADPVFQPSDSRLQDPLTPQDGILIASGPLQRSAFDVGVSFTRLGYSRVEAEQILSLVPPEQRTAAFDFDASRSAATNPELAEYQLIHFATHGLMNSVRPELSGVVFSLVNAQGEEQDGFLRLNDIFNLRLPAELVVLSACETGLDPEVRGEGLVSLTRGFMYAGAKRVVVSLWSVNDLETAELMQRYYQQMLQNNLSPVAALRAAQLEMWGTEEWKAPYYWAAFIIQGDW
uniref:CHAT domain-containing protein n=1 Tax=Desertifilum tharense IPPAS B-1220 TaxID=1781255 RepID=A0ACD5H2N9_9CYAN